MKERVWTHPILNGLTAHCEVHEPHWGVCCNLQESKASTEDAQIEDSALEQPEAQGVPSSMGSAPGPDPVQLVLRIGRGFTPEPVKCSRPHALCDI